MSRATGQLHVALCFSSRTSRLSRTNFSGGSSSCWWREQEMRYYFLGSSHLRLYRRRCQAWSVGIPHLFLHCGPACNSFSMKIVTCISYENMPPSLLWLHHLKCSCSKNNRKAKNTVLVYHCFHDDEADTGPNGQINAMKAWLKLVRIGQAYGRNACRTRDSAGCFPACRTVRCLHRFLNHDFLQTCWSLCRRQIWNLIRARY